MRSVLTALCLLATTAHAVPAQFTHQGRLLDADGVPLEGEIGITFRITSGETGGDVLWQEALKVELNAGFYAAILGTDEDENPLDTDILSQAPVWLELQLDDEPAMFPRSAINAVPYATMATVAEEVSGGPVDASQIAVDGTPVVNEIGEWVGPTPTINWSDLEGMPEGFSDGADSDSFAALGTSCIDGDIAVWDGISMDWNCDLDRDTLADIACTEGQVIAWSDESTGFVCTEDLDTVLTEAQVDAMVADNGYALAADAFSGSFASLTDLPAGLADGDDNTDTLQELFCAAGEIAIQTAAGWTCSTLVEQLDGDGDGTMVWADCDYGDATKGAIALDGDCDGHLSGVDCDDGDSGSTHIGEDADCDGTVTAIDCDDFDPDSTTLLNDADCDGFATESDCDDDDATLGAGALDADCDGTPTVSDCDDTNPDADIWGGDGCPAPSCEFIRLEHPTLDNGNYLIRPSGLSTTHRFFCDLNGTYSTAGSLHLVSAYGAYSVKAYASCGGSGGDADCSPDTDYPTPYYQGALGEKVQFVWRDADDAEVTDEWLMTYSVGISEISASGVRHYAYDADSSSAYKIQFSYLDGTSNAKDNRGSNWGPNNTWVEWTEEGQRMMLGGQHDTEPVTPKIPREINNKGHVDGNWGWHIRFTEEVDGKPGIWLR